MATENDNIFERISGEYYNLTASEKKLADYILANQSGTQFMSISELARSCQVAEATVSRFCRRLGYSGYSTFKLATANAYNQHKPWDNPLSGEIKEDDTLEDVAKKLYTAEIEAITHTMELINPDAIQDAVTLLKKSKRVLCMGQGGSMIIAKEAYHLFSTVCNKFQAVSDSHMQAMVAASAEHSDVVLFFSYSGSAKDMLHTLTLATRRGARVILVTRFPNSPGVDYANVVLQVGSNQNPLQTGSVSARIAQLYLLDVLFSEFSRRDLQNARACRSRIVEALADKHL